MFHLPLAGKSALIIITLARWEWFEKWQNGRLRHRGEDYEGIKDSIGEQMWKVCCHLFPQLDSKVSQKWLGPQVFLLVGWLFGGSVDWLAGFVCRVDFC